MNKILLMIVAIATLTAGVSANDYMSRLEANKADVYKDVSMLVSKHSKLYRYSTITARADKEAFKIRLENCGANVNYSFSDRTGANRTVDLWAFVKNGGDYLLGKDKERLLQYFEFVVRPTHQFTQKYKIKDGVDNSSFERWFKILIINHYKKNTGRALTEFEPLGVAVNYVCGNNGLNDKLVGQNNKVFIDFIYKMAKKDFAGVDKILDKVNHKAAAFGIAIDRMK